MKRSPNQRLHANAAIALLFQVGHHWRGVPELGLGHTTKQNHMRTLIVATAVVALTAAAALGVDEIPVKLKKEAEKTFAEGKSYFIWVSDSQPVKGVGTLEPGGSVVRFTVHFAARDPAKTPRFRIRTGLEIVDAHNKRLTRSTNTAPGGPGEGYSGKPLGEHRTTAVASPGVVKASGIAKVYLILADTKASRIKVISNTFDVKVEFTDKK